MRYFFLGIFLGFVALGIENKCRAEENGIWATTIARSYHLDRAPHYNENNLGVGLEVPFSRTLRLVVGEYENSIWQHSTYAGLTLLPFRISKRIRFGGTAVIITGYQVSPVIAPMATLVYEREHWGINLQTIGAVSALQLKVRW